MLLVESQEPHSYPVQQPANEVQCKVQNRLKYSQPGEPGGQIF